MEIINSSPNLTLLSRALALTALTTNLAEVHSTWVWSSLFNFNLCPLFQAKSKVLLQFQADPLTVFAPSNAAFARANADGWVGDLASLRHLLLRHVVRCQDQIRDKKNVVTFYRKQRQNLKTLCFQGSSSCLFLPIRSQPSQYSQWGKGFQINEHYHHKESLYIPKVTLVSLGKQRAIYSSAGAAALVKTRAARNGVVHVIDSLVWKCWDNP